MKIAMYRNIYYSNIENIFEVTEWMENNKDHIRISKIIEADFPSLSNEILVKNGVEAINSQIQQIYAEAENQVTELKRKRQELLALPNE